VDSEFQIIPNGGWFLTDSNSPKRCFQECFLYDLAPTYLHEIEPIKPSEEVDYEFPETGDFNKFIGMKSGLR
jgi:hypothetical protein